MCKFLYHNLLAHLTPILIPDTSNSTVLHETDSYGSKSGNGSWNGMIALVSNGVADIGIGVFTVTTERSEVVAFTDAIEISG